MLEPGDRAPPVEAEDAYGEAFSLADALEEGAVALYFFPRSFTPG